MGREIEKGPEKIKKKIAGPFFQGAPSYLLFFLKNPSFFYLNQNCKKYFIFLPRRSMATDVIAPCPTTLTSRSLLWESFDSFKLFILNLKL